MPNTLLNTTHNRPHVTSLSASSDKFGIPSVWPTRGRIGDGQVKTCTGCRKEKPIMSFSRDKKGKGGRCAQCKSCHAAHWEANKLALSVGRKAYRRSHQEEFAARDRAYAAANRERIAEYERRHFKAHPEIRRAINRKYKERYPEKSHAYSVVYQAVLTRKLIQGACEECGSTKNVEAHHDDYDKPLDVRWLCSTHHKRLHAAMRREHEQAGCRFILEKKQ